MSRLKKFQFKEPNKKIINLLSEIVNSELELASNFKFAEITTTGIYHDSVVENFKNFTEDHSYYAWQISMILSSYNTMATPQPINVFGGPNKTLNQFLDYIIKAESNLINKYSTIRNLLNKENNPDYDLSAVMVIEDILSNLRMIISELIKLNNQYSLK